MLLNTLITLRIKMQVEIIIGNEKINIQQRDDSIIKLVGNSIDVEKNTKDAILAMTNIDSKYITKFDLPTILSIVLKIRNSFPGFTIDNQIYQCIDKYISDMFDQSFWKRISNSIDCAFDKMERRKFPYFNSSDEEWKSINTRAVKNEHPYPAEMDGKKLDSAVTSTSVSRRDGWKNIEEKAIELIKKSDEKSDEKIVKKLHEATVYRPRSDPDAEKSAESKSSNYYAFDLLEPQFYPDLDEYQRFINMLYKAGLDKLVIKVLHILPLTYECCHIIKHAWFWNMWNELIDDKQLKNYIIYYAFYIMKHEEIKSYSSVPKDARFCFTLQEAKLMNDNIPLIGIDKHPLLHMMEPFGYKSAYLPFFLDGLRRINSMETFKNRLSVATNGLLDGINLAKYHARLSGSILVPCIVTNPLEELFVRSKVDCNIDDLFDSVLNGSFKSSDEKERENRMFRKFLECYYPDYSCIKNDELAHYLEPIQTEEEYQAQKHDDLMNAGRNCPDDIDKPTAFGVLSDLDISIHTDTFDEFKVAVYDLFEVLKTRAMEIASLNKEKDGRIYIRRIKRVNNFKYSIYGPGTNRPIDLFWISKSPDTFVEQFHLGVVRSHWDGNNLIMMGSALSALLTGINQDYRWMSSSKAPAIPVLKYAQRGYSTVLNKFERPILIEYMTAKKEWTDCIKNVDQVFNPVSINNIFFRPDITHSGIQYDLKPIHNGLRQPIISNTRLKWNPIVCLSEGLVLEYYNSAKNSVGQPTLELINQIVNEF